jgi:hypothetical protein
LACWYREYILHFSRELISIEWLLKKGRSWIECALLDHPERWKPGHEQHPHAWPTAKNRLSQLTTSDAWHGNVSHYQIDALRSTLEDPYCFLSAGGLQDVVPLPQQNPGSEAADHFFIVHDKHGLAAR